MVTMGCCALAIAVYAGVLLGGAKIATIIEERKTDKED